MGKSEQQLRFFCHGFVRGIHQLGGEMRKPWHGIQKGHETPGMVLSSYKRDELHITTDWMTGL